MAGGLAPQNDFRGTFHQWEMRVFLNADLYVVYIYEGLGHGGKLYGGTERKEFTSPLPAITEAKKHDRALLYACTNDGRSACLEKALWPDYVAAWKAKLKEKK